MILVNFIHPPFQQKVRNIASLKESFEMTTEQAHVLYERIVSSNLPQEFADDFISKLEVAGWKFIIKDDIKDQRENFHKEAKGWYDNLSSKEREYVAYFQRMMIPTL
jgi:hypothetical protein